MITPIEVNEIPGRKAAFNNSVQAEVLEFYNSEWPACEVKTEHYKTVHSACSAYRAAIEATNVGVIAITRNDRLFLVRK